MNVTKVRTVVLGAALLAPGLASAEEGWLSNIDTSWGGFVRLESAFSTSGDENPYNQRGNPYDNLTMERQAYVPPALLPSLVPILGDVVSGIVTPTWSSLPIPTLLAGDADKPAVRDVKAEDTLMNYAVIRGELEGGLRFNSAFSIIGRLRALYSPDEAYDHLFDAHSVDGIQGGITGGDPALYHRKTNLFAYRTEGSSRPNPLEWSGANYQVYFPALFLQYENGPLNIRAGNQQIAWGQSIFFRVLDVVDGLDLRRHSILDWAQEEFSDKRVPSLAIRATYQATDSILADAYVQKFQPSIFGNPNTPYNVIASQFTVHDMYKEHGYDDNISYGIRLKADYGQYGFQLMATRRWNPDGAFRWTQSGVNKDLPHTIGSTGELVNLAYSLRPGALYGSSGEALMHSPFEVAPAGVYSAREFFNFGHMTRLDSIGALNAAITEYPGPEQVFASPVDNVTDALHELDTFFIAAGGSMRGHIAREYFQENVFGAGASYITEGEPGGWLDQLIINAEVSYTPDRTYTAPSLTRKFLREDAFVGALVLEKYQRFSEAIPATYLVLQYMYRSADDMVGRNLKGYGGSYDLTGTPSPPTGVSNAQYVAFAAQQPLAHDIWRFGFATLYDVRGGILVQPGVTWKPRGDVTVDAFYSYLNGKLGGNPNKNLMSTLDFADEFSLRVAYQF